MRISIDLQSDPRIRRMPGVLERIAPMVANVAAEQWVEETLDWIASGRSFVSRTGQLEQSIGWAPSGTGAEVYANAEHARYVEEGTKPHAIEPKARKALKVMMPGGGYILRKMVDHPGSKPYPFLFADVEGRKERLRPALLRLIADEVLA